MLTILCVVVSTLSVFRRIVSDGATDAIRIAMVTVGVLMSGAALETVLSIGFFVGIGAALTFAIAAIRVAVARRRWNTERLISEPPSASTRLILHDRIDLLERRTRRPAIILLSLVALSLIGASSIWRGFDAV